MESEAGENKLRDWWLAISIQHKMLLFLGLVIAMVAMVTLFSVGMISIYLSDFNVVLGDSYGVNAMLTNFEREEEMFRQFSSYRTEELETAYRAARRNTTRSLMQMRFERDGMSTHRYLLLQAIHISYDSFTRQCELVLGLPEEADTFIPQYYYALKIGNYIDGYIKNLMQMTIAEGNDAYYDKVRFFRVLPGVVLLMACVVLFFATLLSSITVRNIINPVVTLARASREIAANHFDAPDVQVTNQDEIGELVCTFNNMKHSMARSIATLQEKGEMEHRLHQEELQRVNAEQMLKTAQMSLLQSQINPHFLFNTLNIISRMAKIETAPTTEELIQRLSNLFRYNLQTDSAKVTLTRELNIINDYIYIQRKRFGSRIGFEIVSYVDSDCVMVPTFTLQPLVENAVIHGISPKEEGGRIRIRIYRHLGGVVVDVTDNGVGMPAPRLEALMNGSEKHRGHVSGIGLNNVRTRIETLYPGSRVRVFSRVGLGTAIRVYLTGQAIDLGGKEEETKHV